MLLWIEWIADQYVYHLHFRVCLNQQREMNM